MNEPQNVVLVDAIKVVVGLVLGFLLGEPIKRLGKRLWGKQEENWKRRDRVAPKTQPRPTLRVTQLCDPKEPFDFASVLKEQNHRQDLFLFEIDDLRRYARPDEVIELRRLESKKQFLDRVGSLLARMRGENWEGLGDRPPDTGPARRDFVITDIPLPGKFYGWNSRDRRYLLISTAPIARFFCAEGGPTIEDFVVRMAQRMAVFGVSPSLDPLAVHAGTSAGCLFDFNVLLQGVVDVVKEPGICPTCASSIARDRGDEF